jgi:hypothetical protein
MPAVPGISGELGKFWMQLDNLSFFSITATLETDF